MVGAVLLLEAEVVLEQDHVGVLGGQLILRDERQEVAVGRRRAHERDLELLTLVHGFLSQRRAGLDVVPAKKQQHNDPLGDGDRTGNDDTVQLREAEVLCDLSVALLLLGLQMRLQRRQRVGRELTRQQSLHDACS